MSDGFLCVLCGREFSMNELRMTPLPNYEILHDLQTEDARETVKLEKPEGADQAKGVVIFACEECRERAWKKYEKELTELLKEVS